jgi:hypothetical protein
LRSISTSWPGLALRVIPAIQVCVGATKKDVDALLKALQGRDFRFGQKRPDFLHQTRAAYFLAPRLKRERSLLPSFGQANGNYHNISNTWLGYGFLSSSPLTPATESRITASKFSLLMRRADVRKLPPSLSALAAHTLQPTRTA